MLTVALPPMAVALDEAFVLHVALTAHPSQKGQQIQGGTTKQRGWPWLGLLCRTLCSSGPVAMVYVLCQVQQRHEVGGQGLGLPNAAPLLWWAARIWWVDVTKAPGLCRHCAGCQGRWQGHGLVFSFPGRSGDGHLSPKSQ